MTDDTMLPFLFPAVHAKKITAAFDGGRLTSNGGVMLLAMAERRLGLTDNLARVFPDRRDPTRVVHSLVDMFRARMFAICCGYEDADDLDDLRSDPAFKLPCGRLPARAGAWRPGFPVEGCRIAVAICVLSRPCRAWRMLRACAR
jgi:hypothetical protein